MLTVAEARAHERKLRRLLIGSCLGPLFLVQSLVISEAGFGDLARMFGVIGGVLLIWFGIAGSVYVMKDLRLRGASPLWAFGLGGTFGFFAWLIWRSAHPIPTRDSARR